MSFWSVIEGADSSGSVALNIGGAPALRIRQEKFLIPTSAASPERCAGELRAANNIYQAFGASLENPVYQGTRETNTRALKLNTNVAYTFTPNCLLRDPLGPDPTRTTGRHISNRTAAAAFRER